VRIDFSSCRAAATKVEKRMNTLIHFINQVVQEARKVLKNFAVANESGLCADLVPDVSQHMGENKGLVLPLLILERRRSALSFQEAR
jgi:hypothetical protein